MAVSGKPRAILPPLICVHSQPDGYHAVHAYVQRVQAEARTKTQVIYLDPERGRPVADVAEGGAKIQDTVYPWSKESILREMAATFETELKRSKYGTNDVQFRHDLSAVLEGSQIAANLAPGPRLAAKLRSPPLLVTDSEKLLGFFNRPVVLATLGEAMARHGIPALIPLCNIRDLDPVSCRIENQPLEWGSEELPCCAVHRPLPSIYEGGYPDLWRRPLSAYTCVERRMPKGFRLVFGRYELMQDGDCICRFVLHPEGQFEWWQSRLFRGEDIEKTACKGSGKSAGQWTVGPGSVLTLEGVFNHVTSNLPRVHEKIVLSLEWLSQSWAVTEMQEDRLVRPTALQALERAPWPTVRCGTYTYQQISGDGDLRTGKSLGDLSDGGHLRGSLAEDVRITLSLYETGWYEYAEERRLHRARKQSTTAVHLGRRWEFDLEQRCVRLTAPTKQALRQRRYATGTQMEDLWVHSVEIPLARLDKEFAFYPHEGAPYPDGVVEPKAVTTHYDLSCPLASMGSQGPARRIVTGGTSWQNVDPSAYSRPLPSKTREAAAQMMGSNSSWRSSWKSGAFKHTAILQKTGSASAIHSDLQLLGSLGSGGTAGTGGL